MSQCSHCLKTFARAFSKNRHEKICFKLQAKTRLHCYICGKGFVNVQKRVKHELTCVNVGGCPLEDLKKFQCKKCFQTFVSKQKSEQHRCKVKRASVKQSTIQCKDCLKTFSSLFNKKRHEKVCVQKGQTKEIADGANGSNGYEREELPKKRENVNVVSATEYSRDVTNCTCTKTCSTGELFRTDLGVKRLI